MSDPLVDVAVRVYADFAEHATLAEVLAVVARSRTDLDTPSAGALPELVERLARRGWPTTSPRLPPRTERLLKTANSSPTGDAEISALGAARRCEPTAGRPAR
jgi:hypothetical protein